MCEDRRPERRILHRDLISLMSRQWGGGGGEIKRNQVSNVTYRTSRLTLATLLLGTHCQHFLESALWM